MILEGVASRLDELPNLKFFLVGVVYFSIALFLAWWKFSSHIGLVSVFLTVLAAFPFFYSTIREEEELDESEIAQGALLKSHGKVLLCFMMLFVGIVVASAFWFLVLPADIVAPQNGGAMFGVQLDAIGKINPSLLGKATTESNIFYSVKSFVSILSHNVEILVLCILFSFLYGAGAVFILTWNASVIGVAIGSYVKTLLIVSAGDVGYLGAIISGLMRFTLHGIPEMLAFFMAGLAGGIISVAVIRHHLFTKKARTVILDSYNLIIISLILLVVAAFLEVYITPLLFSSL